MIAHLARHSDEEVKAVDERSEWKVSLRSWMFDEIGVGVSSEVELGAELCSLSLAKSAITIANLRGSSSRLTRYSLLPRHDLQAIVDFRVGSRRGTT